MYNPSNVVDICLIHISDSPVDRINEAELLKDTPYDANYDSDHFENDINFDELEAINEFVGYELNAQNPLNLSQENAMNRIGKVKEQNVAGTSLAKPKSDTRYRRLNAELTTFVKEQNVAGTSLAKPKSTIAYHLLNQVQNVAGTLLAKPVRQANGVEELEEQNVAGTSLAKPKKNPVYYQLLDMFPDIDPEYLTEFCSQRNVPVDEQISILLAGKLYDTFFYVSLKGDYFLFSRLSETEQTGEPHGRSRPG